MNTAGTSAFGDHRSEAITRAKALGLQRASDEWAKALMREHGVSDLSTYGDLAATTPEGTQARETYFAALEIQSRAREAEAAVRAGTMTPAQASEAWAKALHSEHGISDLALYSDLASNTHEGSLARETYLAAKQMHETAHQQPAPAQTHTNPQQLEPQAIGAAPTFQEAAEAFAGRAYTDPAKREAFVKLIGERYANKKSPSRGRSQARSIKPSGF